MTQLSPHSCQCFVHGDHAGCDSVCAMTTGCVWPVRPVAPAPAAEQLRRAVFIPPDHEMIITGPALHETQARAYALIAAAQLSTGENWTPQGLEFWRHHVLHTADMFTQYITTGRPKPTPSGSEDS